jgi:hypothetical protein
LVSNKNKPKGGLLRQTPQEVQAELQEKLNEHRKKIAKARLSIDDYRNPDFLKFHKNRYDFYIFNLNRDLCRDKGASYLAWFKDIYKPDKLRKVEHLFNELTLYGHLVFYDFKPYPDKILTRMIGNINVIQKRLIMLRKTILKHNQMPFTIQERHRLGIGSGMPTGFPLHTLDELDTIEWEMIFLRDIIEADKKVPSNTKTNFKAKMQYFFYLCNEIFACVNFKKYPVSSDEKSPDYWEKVRKEFYIRMAEEIHQLSQTEKGRLLDACYLKPDEKKYKVKKFQNLIGITNIKDFDKARKSINF